MYLLLMIGDNASNEVGLGLVESAHEVCELLLHTVTRQSHGNKTVSW